MKNISLIIVCILFMSIGCSRVERDWENAQKMDIIDSYEQFINKHPKSSFVEAAQKRIHKLYAFVRIGRLAVLLPDQIKGYKELPFTKHPSRFIAKSVNDNGRVRSLSVLDGSWYRINLFEKGIFNLESNFESLATEHGAEHVWLGRFIANAGWSIESNDEMPLTFKVDNQKGYIYIAGLGTFVSADGKKYEFNSLPDIDQLRNLLFHPDSVVRQGSAQTLVWLKDSSVIPDLIKALEDNSWEVRRDVVYALGSMDNLSIVEPLLKMLDDPDSWVREVSVEALRRQLGAVNDKKLKKTILDSIKKHNKENGGLRVSASGNFMTKCGSVKYSAEIGHLSTAYQDSSMSKGIGNIYVFVSGQLCQPAIY